MSIDNKVDLSIVVVNYNVKEYVSNLFSSIERAKKNYTIEVFLVDNSSVEGSIEYLKKNYPHYNYIRNKENIGFGKANNLAINQAKGEYTLIINPDTLISEDTIETMIDYMKQHPKCGAAGCKLLNADGSYAPESKRSFPSISNSFFKISGLGKLLSKKSKLNSYYANHLEENESGTIEVLSGAFMFFRTSILQKLEGFDQRFFMYGEDIDLCKRTIDLGYTIDYVPFTNIIHYKGESAKQNDLTYIKSFNGALYLYFDKHFGSKYSSAFKAVIWLAVTFKTLASFFSLFAKKLKPLFVDLTIINITLLISLVVRHKLWLDEQYLSPDSLRFLWTNLIVSVSYTLLAQPAGLLEQMRHSVAARIKTLTITFAVLAILSFFFKNIAFSRVAVLSSVIITVGIFTVIYTWRKSTGNNPGQWTGNLRATRILLVGVDINSTKELISKLRAKVEWSYELVGLIEADDSSQEISEIDGVPVMGKISQLNELIRAYRINQVHFAMNTLSYKQILNTITHMQDLNVIAKIIPDSMDYILGKSNVEYLADIAMIDLEIRYYRWWNKWVKRALDLFLGLPLYAYFTLRTIGVSKDRYKLNKYRFTAGEDAELNLELYENEGKGRLLNFKKLLKKVIQAKMSLVGAPLHTARKYANYGYFFGITGFWQVNPNSSDSVEDLERFDLYYLQNYSIWLDLDILVKTLFRRPDVLKGIDKADAIQ